MSFHQEVFDFVQLQLSEQVTIKDETIHVASINVSFELRFLSKKANESHPGSSLIWEDQWAAKRPIIESRILSVLGKSKRIYGRETSIVKLTQPETNDFLKENHLIGTTQAKTKLGLSKNGEILAVATFSKPTKIDRNGKIYKSYEMIRYCTLNGFTVVGGLSKLLNHFISIVQPDDIMTYVDSEWSKGNSFSQLGFTMVEQTPPLEFWIDLDSLTRHRLVDKRTLPPNAIIIKNAGSYKFIKFLK